MRQFAIPKYAIKPVAAWLMVIIVMLVAMIVLGGLTRITDSGLSITEWQPIRGVIPPLSVDAWQAEFDKYRQIPEYKYQNSGMSLNEFKTIYWWEWAHRLLGRAIGLVVFLPMVFFWLRGFLSPALKVRLVTLFCLGGLQGFLGWWMVSSGLGGLGNLLDVSPYRLVVHLGMALLILGLTVWTWIDVKLGRTRLSWHSSAAMGQLAWAVLLLVVLQILLGGFVAGNDGGLVANTWPLMEGRVFPGSYGELQPIWRNWFESPLITQFHHRMVAYLLLLVSLVFWWKSRQQSQRELRRSSLVLILSLGLQVVLGIWTLLMVSPLFLAIAHQLLAVIIFLMALNLAHANSKTYGAS